MPSPPHSFGDGIPPCAGRTYAPDACPFGGAIFLCRSGSSLTQPLEERIRRLLLGPGRRRAPGADIRCKALEHRDELLLEERHAELHEEGLGDLLGPDVLALGELRGDPGREVELTGRRVDGGELRELDLDALQRQVDERRYDGSQQLLRAL